MIGNKTINIFLCLFFFISLLISFSCASSPSCISVTPPKISFTGKQSAIERQIVGEYKEIEKDAWIVSSIKTTISRSKSSESLSAGDKELYRALKVIEFHQMKIRSYKNEGALGESYNGYISYRPINKYERNKHEKEILFKIIDEENRARLTVFKRTLFLRLKRQPAEDEISSFGQSFAREMRAMGQKGDWVQNKNSNWTFKK